MRSSAALRHIDGLVSDANHADEFANELSLLSQKHRIGITGDPVLFVLDQDDNILVYGIDDDSKLVVMSA